MVLMKDIADAVGVSKATVSMVLNGNGGSRVSDAMRQKVLNAAKEMGYHGNDLARSLRTGKTHVIAVLVTDISNDFFGRMSFFIQEEAKKYGYLVITANTNESDEELDSMISVLLGKKVDGIIVVPTPDCAESVRRVTDTGIPVVQIDRYVDGVDAGYVGTDNYRSTSFAIAQLVEAGKKRIGMVTLDLGVNAISERRRGYVQTLSLYGCYHPELEKSIAFDDIDEVKKAIGEILSNSPDAIFFSSGRVFSIAMEILSNDNPKKDISLLCFDKAASYKGILNNKLWYIEQPIEQMAKRAFSLLIEAIDGSKDYPKLEYLSTLVK